MFHYDTMVAALEDVKKRGFTLDFNLHYDKIQCHNPAGDYDPARFEIVEIHRFEGMSSTDDNSILYLIITDDGRKGSLVDAYGVYGDGLSPEMIKKMRVHYA
ncbi:MAG: phosphoribosylpyrophosphate synthetase [Saprospiraceae bacterium]|nr:phosphoribosylpyrophosphate synthetase [Saprospiraceae bacterium]